MPPEKVHPCCPLTSESTDMFIWKVFGLFWLVNCISDRYKTRLKSSLSAEFVFMNTWGWVNFKQIFSFGWTALMQTLKYTLEGSLVQTNYYITHLNRILYWASKIIQCQHRLRPCCVSLKSTKQMIVAQILFLHLKMLFQNFIFKTNFELVTCTNWLMGSQISKINYNRDQHLGRESWL